MNEFQKRAEVVQHAKEVMRDVVAEHAEKQGDLIVGTLTRYESCENCLALMAVLDDLISQEPEGSA